MQPLTHHFGKLSQKLPLPYTITKDQVRCYYQNLYDKLLDSFNNNDFYRIDKLLDISNYKLVIPRMKLHYLTENASNDTLAADLAQLLFKIITIYPVKYFKAQYAAANYLFVFLNTNEQIPGLKFEWRPFYKVMKYYSNPKQFFPSIKETLTFNKFSILCFLISEYFPDEIETQIDGVTVKTNTTEQLFKKFIIKKDITNFDRFLPISKGRYKLFLPFFVNSLQENSNNINFLPTILRSIHCNIEDDFSCLLLLVKNLVSAYILNSSRKNSRMLNSSLCKMICALFISPPTRLGILELFDKILPTLRCLCRSSSPSTSNFIRTFVMQTVLTTFDYLKRLNKDEPNKANFNMKKELGPSQEEIHRLFTMTSEINILGVHMINSSSQVQIETKVDPLLIDRYFEVALSCINSTELASIAKGGWYILNALISSIEKSETLLNNFDAIFRFAVNNLHDFALHHIISNFIVSVFVKVPFNSEKTIRALEHVNFAELANLFFSKLFEIFRSLPPTSDGTAQISQDLTESTTMSSIFLLRYCDDSVKNELLPLLISLATDESVAGCYEVIEIIYVNYANSSSREQVQKISKAFRRQIDLEHHDSNMLRFLLFIYSTLLIANVNTVESAKETIDVFLKFTNNEDEKVRKIAWHTIYNSLTLIGREFITDISFKKGVIKDNIFELVNFKDFEIKEYPLFDITDLSYNVFDPIYDKLLTLKDPKEVTKLLNDIGPYIFFTLNDFNEYPEGSTDDINEIYRGPINVSPNFIKKSFPCKEKYIKCVIRLVKDFPDNENIITQIVINTLLLGYNPSNFTDIIEDHFVSYDFSKAHYNLPYLEYMTSCTKSQRKSFLIPPLTDDMKELISLVADLSVSNNKNIQATCISFLKKAIVYYDSYVNQVIEKIINKDHSNHYKEYIFFLVNVCNEDCISYNDKLLCKIILFLLDNFNSNDEESLSYVQSFFSITCLQTNPSRTNKSNTPEYIDLLKEIEDKYLYKYPMSRTYNQLIVEIIILCMKQVDEISDKVLEYIIRSVTHYNEQVSVFAQVCFVHIMERRLKFTKEKVMIDKFPTVADFSNIFDQVAVQFPSNGLYFPHSLNVISENEEEKQSENTLTEYSIESDPTNSLDVNITDYTINEDVKKVFSTFKKIKIEWNYDEFYDSDYFQIKEFSMNFRKDHYYRKKYEFHENELLMKNIMNLFASATNSINETNPENGIHYDIIWEQYSLTVGPYCTKKMSKICNKYLSCFYEKSPIITTRILADMITGFMLGIRFWPIEERINFFKLVVLPVTCVISSNPKTLDLVESIYMNANIFSNPYTFAPLVKIFYLISPKGPNLPVYSRTLTLLISKQVSLRHDLFFNAIDQLHEQYIVDFMNRMSEYNLNEVGNIIQIFFFFIDASTDYLKTSPFYSEEVEEKKQFAIKTLDDILSLQVTDENMKHNFIRFLTDTLVFFSTSLKIERQLIVPVLIKHLHTIFVMLNNSNENEEQLFIQSMSLFICNDIFFAEKEIEFSFVSALVKELMSSSLPMQLVLLESANVMLENNVINMSEEDYSKYEEILLNYNRHTIANNIGKEVRMKIAKILGIFEIRRCTFDPNAADVEDNVLKAAGIVLNTFLFDHVDEIVTRALEYLEEKCSRRDSKNKDFFEGVSEIFIHRHSNHVINEAYEMVSQYSSRIHPSYMS